LCNFLHSPVTSFHLGTNILLRTLFSNILSLCSSLIVRDQVSHPYKTTGRIMVLSNTQTTQFEMKKTFPLFYTLSHGQSRTLCWLYDSKLRWIISSSDFFFILTFLVHLSLKVLLKFNTLVQSFSIILYVGYIREMSSSKS
jgi:hypothetical protein